MATDMTVSTTILAQLGGRMFLTMTGAKALVGGKDYLSMQLPGRNKDRINAMKITLTPADEYNVEFIRVARKNGVPSWTVVKKHEGVYCDQLQELFTRATGLYTHM